MSERLAVRGITKRFPGVLANDRVDFAVEPGEIHALLGENGAGKSTLVKMIYGVLHPDEGEIRWDGTARSIDDPKTARSLGIGMVFQHFSLFEAMSVLENIALGMDRPPSMSWHWIGAHLWCRLGNLLMSERYKAILIPLCCAQIKRLLRRRQIESCTR